MWLISRNENIDPNKRITVQNSASRPLELRLRRGQVHFASQTVVNLSTLRRRVPGTLRRLVPNFIYEVYKNKRVWERAPYAKRHVAEGQQCHTPGGASQPCLEARVTPRRMLYRYRRRAPARLEVMLNADSRQVAARARGIIRIDG